MTMAFNRIVKNVMKLVLNVLQKPDVPTVSVEQTGNLTPLQVNVTVNSDSKKLLGTLNVKNATPTMTSA
jgi:S-ribosylhomocysteine lyase LuxS involved in autoinducer biosynthesis